MSKGTKLFIKKNSKNLFIGFSILLFLLMFLKILYSANNPYYTYLLHKYDIEQRIYTHNGLSIKYSEKIYNKQKQGDLSLVLLIHSGPQRFQLARELGFPAVKSLLDYVYSHDAKIIIIMPQYPAVPGDYSDELNNLVEQLTITKIKKYNIPRDKIYATGASKGSKTIYYIASKNKNLFSKIVLVSSSFYETKLNTKMYVILGEKDNPKKINEFTKLVKKLPYGNKFETISNKNHKEAVKAAYTDKIWNWMFAP